MFCARCGKQIDDDSTFCPFCGQQVDAPVTNTGSDVKTKSVISQGIKKSLALQSVLSNKRVWGIALALVVVAVVGVGAVKLIGGTKMKSVPEKLFDMSWEEFCNTSLDDMFDTLDNADIFYSTSYPYDDGFITTVAEPFFQGKGFIKYSGDSPSFSLYVGFSSTDDLKKFKSVLENYLTERVIKKAAVMAYDSDDSIDYVYPVGMSTKKMDSYLERYIFNNYNELTLDDFADGDYAIYKAVKVSYVRKSFEDWMDGTAVFAPDDTYIGQFCIVNVNYSLMTKSEFISRQAEVGHDAISGKEIDLDKFKSSVDEKLVREYLNKKVRENPESREDLEKDFYTKLYMMEKHDLDMGTRSYLKTKEEKKLWYIRNFSWDTDTQSMMDFSEYRNSSDIYCAVEFNYDSSKAEYFESELDKALYLADRNYKLGTGNDFESNEEKRLWFMKNYSYDISSGKVIEKEVVDALIAYQRYMDQTAVNIESYQYADEKYFGLAYIDNDDIPDMVLHTSVGISDEFYILSYHKDDIIEGYIYNNYGSISYAEKKNLFRISEGRMGFYSDRFYSLVDDELSTVAEGVYGEKWEDNHSVMDAEGNYIYEYSWNGVECGEDDYHNSINALCDSQAGGAEWKEVAGYGSNYTTVLDAYDALRTTEYQILAYEFTEFNLSDGILTFSSDGAARYGQEDAKSFSYSFPVAENCTWGYYHAGENYPYEESDYEDMKDLIESDMELYAKDFENYGDIGWDSPAGYYITVTDNEVVDVRVIYS